MQQPNEAVHNAPPEQYPAVLASAELAHSVVATRQHGQVPGHMPCCYAVADAQEEDAPAAALAHAVLHTLLTPTPPPAKPKPMQAAQPAPSVLASMQASPAVQRDHAATAATQPDQTDTKPRRPTSPRGRGP